ncbi:MAG: hydrogen gas-evolving membrane-bound hydrogenase subunit E, partial [Actinomycetota bacterium]
ARAPSWGFAWPPVALAAFSVIAGLAPIIVNTLVKSATIAIDPAAKPKDVVLWAGFNQALLWSTIIIAAGIALAVMRHRVEALQTSVGAITRKAPNDDRIFWGIVTGALSFAKRTTRVVQNGSLPIYLMIILSVTAIGSALPAFWALGDLPDWYGDWVHIPIAVLIVGSTIGATVVKRRIAAALLLGAVGFAMAGFYVSFGAPDLALTQFAIETLATVLFVLVLRFLPRSFVDTRAAILGPLRLVVSISIGVCVFVLALAATGARSDVAAPSISDEMLERSVPDGKGSNVVNVILVDFRGLDTLGEVTVLLVAALGVVALARAARRPGDARPGRLEAFGRLPLVDVSSRLLYANIFILSLYFLFAGHNQPGGGFVGGLTAGAAISLRYVAGGVAAVRSAIAFRPWTVLASGLVISAVTALVPLVTGNDVLEHADYEGTFWLIGKLKVTSALPFDIGVYLVVVGLVLMAYEGFGERGDFDDDGNLISDEPEMAQS